MDPRNNKAGPGSIFTAANECQPFGDSRPGRGGLITTSGTALNGKQFSELAVDFPFAGPLKL